MSDASKVLIIYTGGTIGMVEDPETGLLMSKSKGTGIFLNTTARDMFGQSMSQGDGMIEPLLKHCTTLPLEEIQTLMKGENPRDAKIRMAYEIVKIFHGEEKAEEEKKYFIETFSKKHIDVQALEVIEMQEGELLMDILIREHLAESKSDARRKIEQGGVSVGEEKIINPQFVLDHGANGKVLRVGKKWFRKLKI